MQIDPDILSDRAPMSPRDWQRSAISEAIDALRAEDPTRGVIHAIMGSGKSYVIGALCAACMAGCEETTVVTTPTQRLVDQLADTIRDWTDPHAVGTFDGRDKQPHREIVVCCIPSVPTLAETIDDCALWLADEAHRTECKTVHDAHDTLDPTEAIGFSATPYRADDDERLSLFADLLYEYTAADALDDGIVVPYRVEHWTGEQGVDIDRACIEMIDQHAEGPGVVNAPKSHKIGSHIDDAEGFADRLSDQGIAARAVHSQLDDDQIDFHLRQLKDGHLDAVVHVNILSEGVDLPWLQWLCLRRPTGSQVRYTQEVGRVLRADEGKDHALLLDPRDLTGAFALDAEAILGAGETPGEAADTRASRELMEAMGLTPGGGAGLPGTDDLTIEGLSKVSATLRQWRLAFEQSGLFDPQVTSTHWRDRPPTDGQTRYLNQLIKKTSQTIRTTAPDDVRWALKAAFKAYRGGHLNRGDVSDWISILKVVDQLERWPDREAMMLEAV